MIRGLLISDEQTFDQRIGLNQEERENHEIMEGTAFQSEGAASAKV